MQRTFLIVRSFEYPDVVAALIDGARSAFKTAEPQTPVQEIEVPSLLQIPSVIKYAVKSMEEKTTEKKFAGFIALGCLPIPHTESNLLMYQILLNSLEMLRTKHSLVIGDGIISEGDHEKALHLSERDGADYGGKAVRECLQMLAVKKEFGL